MLILFYQLCTLTAKTRAIPVLHRDNSFGLSGQLTGRLLRRVT
jgi:hypothetical protein